MKEFLKIVLLLIYSKMGFAQQDSLWPKPNKNSIYIGAGLVHTRLIDEGFTQSKLLFRGTNPKIGLAYGRQNIRSVFNFNTAISSGSIRTKQSELTTRFVNVSAAMQYIGKIKAFRFRKREAQLFAGLQVSSINYIIHNDPVFDNIAVFSLHGIYFKLEYQLHLDKKQAVQVDYAIPAMVYANRVLWNSGASIYASGDQKKILKLLTTHGRFCYFNFLNNIQIDLIYKKHVSKKVEFNARYAFRYVNNSIESLLRLYSNELIMGLKFEFR